MFKLEASLKNLESLIKNFGENIAGLTKMNLQAHKSVSQLSSKFDSYEISYTNKLNGLNENLKSQ